MNRDIIYIDCLNSYLDILKIDKFKFLKKIIYKICNWLGIVISTENYFKLVCLEKDKINSRMINNLFLKIRTISSKNIVLADQLLQNKEFVKILESKNYNILNGTWLYKFLTYNIVEKIAYIQNTKIENMEITVLTNEDSDINIENIKLLALKCKVLNILTDESKKFEILEKFLFDEYGIIINVSTNKRKTALHSNVILNFDFSIDKIKQCDFRKKTVVVQFTKENYENANGVVIVFYKIKLPTKYSKLLVGYNNFSEETMYESFLYHKLSFKNLRKILYEDNIQIKYFIGNSGKIQFTEIKENLYK